MTSDHEKIPPFMQGYLDRMNHEGYVDFVKLSRGYRKEREEYPGKYATQSAHLNEFNRAIGQNRKLDYEDGLKRIDVGYRKKAYEIAKQHGYTGPDPNQPSDKEFTRQGGKFQNMIDQARERQQAQTEQSGQPQQNQEAAAGEETENIDKLKDQRPYQQNPPKVEFKGMEQQELSGNEPDSREQQRAAFLEQVKKTREQQVERQPDKQREM